jgi:hypothetical protein
MGPPAPRFDRLDRTLEDHGRLRSFAVQKQLPAGAVGRPQVPDDILGRSAFHGLLLLYLPHPQAIL